MSKVKKNAPPTKHETAHLEDTITQVSDRVAVIAKRYWVPIVVACVAVVGLLGISSIYQWFAKTRQEELASEIYNAFDGPNDEANLDAKRGKLEKVWSEIQGETIESVFAVRYARWLWQDAKNPQRAVQVLDEATKRHPEDKVLEFFRSRYAQTLKASEGFVIPTPPPPPEPIVPTPIPTPTPGPLPEAPPTVDPPAPSDG
ncbi:MAG: hypothetical protein AB7I09_02710 [Planctomycetota bacterium]